MTYSLSAYIVLFYSAMFSAVSVITIKRNPWVSIYMSTTSIMLIGALYMAIG
jgi:hypothetical protein